MDECGMVLKKRWIILGLMLLTMLCFGARYCILNILDAKLSDMTGAVIDKWSYEADGVKVQVKTYDEMEAFYSRLFLGNGINVFSSEKEFRQYFIDFYANEDRRNFKGESLLDVNEKVQSYVRCISTQYDDYFFATHKLVMICRYGDTFDIRDREYFYFIPASDFMEIRSDGYHFNILSNFFYGGSVSEEEIEQIIIFIEVPRRIIGSSQIEVTDITKETGNTP